MKIKLFFMGAFCFHLLFFLICLYFYLLVIFNPETPPNSGWIVINFLWDKYKLICIPLSIVSGIVTVCLDEC